MNPPAGRRIGLLGGTFDPPHNAHLALAHAALGTLRLEQVRWIPTGEPWYKTRAITTAEHRTAMVRLAIEGETRYALDRLEVDRPGPSYTIDTLQALAVREPQVRWVLILGQDQFARLASWHRWQELVQRAELAVAARAGDTAVPPPEVQRLARTPVPMPPSDVSASDIRARAAAGRDISALVPDAVARYIARHGLYR